MDGRWLIVAHGLAPGFWEPTSLQIAASVLLLLEKKGQGRSLSLSLTQNRSAFL